MKKFSKIIVILTIIMVTLGTSGFLVYYFVFRDNASTIPCVERPFTHYPVNMTRLTSLVPLGNLNPPDHTYPTDHMYFFTDTLTYLDGFEIYAPGNMTITYIRKVTYDPPQGVISTDFTIDFDVCRHVSGSFGHVNNLSTYLLDLVGEFGEEYGDEVWSYSFAGRTYTSYRKRVNINVFGGDVLGRAAMGGGYDFWLKDDRVELFWINNDITEYFQHTVCPLDYFVDDLKTILHAELGGWIAVDPPGYCGKIDFDVPNTAQGIWQKEVWSGDSTEEFGLALVYSNFNASKGAFSIADAGNSTWDKNVYYFTPTDIGFMNRNFSQVTNDGNIYYYLCEEFKTGMIYTKVILIKMTADRELYLQFIDQDGVEIPADPTVLYNQALAIKYIR
ncbi:MAG: hypothetical protein KAQ95_04780 [Candidatus Heimdallarchaeota archaeon]|nr:hypothetical protein [Candidatus Heimdallarchaeota archaeon]